MWPWVAAGAVAVGAVVVGALASGAPVPAPQALPAARGPRRRVDAPSWAPSPFDKREHRLGQPFAWGKEAERKLGRAWRDKLERVSVRLQIDPGAIATQIKHESGWSPTITNRIGAKGFIQFIPSTQRGLLQRYGVVVSDDPFQQLDAVYFYYLGYRARLGAWPPPVDVFFATFTSRGLRQRPDFVIFDQGDKAYHLNKGADRDGDGDIDVEESSRRFRESYRRGFAEAFYG